jgi:hypothetical protein
MKEQKDRNEFLLGELIVALFEESKKYSSDRVEQKILVFAALKDLLNRKVRSYHPITIHP